MSENKKYMSNGNILIALAIVTISFAMAESRILGDMMVFPLFLSLLYLTITFGFRSFEYLADNQSIATRLFLVLSIIIALITFILYVFFDVNLLQTPSYPSKISERISSGIFISILVSFITLTVFVIIYKVTKFIFKGFES